MASPENTPSAPGPAQPQYAERSYRSSAGMASGVLLLALGLWLGGDAVLRGEGSTPWRARAGRLVALALGGAGTRRPGGYGGDDRRRVRSPSRTNSAPGAAGEGIREGGANGAAPLAGGEEPVGGRGGGQGADREVVSARGVRPGAEPVLVCVHAYPRRRGVGGES